MIVPNGQSVFGAYNRKLLVLSGGYSSTHSNVHLWYHGTIDLATPTSDTQATTAAGIGESRRATNVAAAATAAAAIAPGMKRYAASGRYMAIASVASDQIHHAPSNMAQDPTRRAATGPRSATTSSGGE